MARLAYRCRCRPPPRRRGRYWHRRGAVGVVINDQLVLLIVQRRAATVVKPRARVRAGHQARVQWLVQIGRIRQSPMVGGGCPNRVSGSYASGESVSLLKAQDVGGVKVEREVGGEGPNGFTTWMPPSASRFCQCGGVRFTRAMIWRSPRTYARRWRWSG